MTHRFGLAATLYDAAALAEAFGPGAGLGFGAAGLGPDNDIMAPSGRVLSTGEAGLAAKAGHGGYFLAFGQSAVVAAGIAPLIEVLAAATGIGFMAACPAAPWARRTIYQGHLFEDGNFRGNLVQEFGLALGGGVGLVAHDVVRAGATAIRKACARLKEQGRILAIIDAIDDDDCAAIAEALAGQILTGGSAWVAALPHAPEPATAPGMVAIISGALDRQTNFQIGAARPHMPVFDFDFSAADPVAQACAFAASQTEPFIITSTVAPDRLTPGAPAAAMLAAGARHLAETGISRFIIAGDETAAACLKSLGVTRLTTNAGFGPLRWLQGDTVSLCFKPAGAGGKNLFLSEFEPQNRLNEEAKSPL
jgi:uncharacterized protein YgbK (DUF1537 family)